MTDIAKRYVALGFDVLCQTDVPTLGGRSDLGRTFHLCAGRPRARELNGKKWGKHPESKVAGLKIHHR